MYVKELDSLVKKFHQLWNDGLAAHLDLDTQAANAWVGLHIQLGHVPGPLHQVHPLKMSKRVVDNTKKAASGALEEAGPTVEANEGVEEASDKHTVGRRAYVPDDIAEKTSDKKTVENTANDVSDDIAEESLVVNEIVGDCDVYNYTYWDNFKLRQAQEAINYIEVFLKRNF